MQLDLASRMTMPMQMPGPGAGASRMGKGIAGGDHSEIRKIRERIAVA
jgi:hypothetical protein